MCMMLVFLYLKTSFLTANTVTTTVKTIERQGIMNRGHNYNTQFHNMPFVFKYSVLKLYVAFVFRWKFTELYEILKTGGPRPAWCCLMRSDRKTITLKSHSLPQNPCVSGKSVACAASLPPSVLGHCKTGLNVYSRAWLVSAVRQLSRCSR